MLCTATSGGGAIISGRVARLRPQSRGVLMRRFVGLNFMSCFKLWCLTAWVVRWLQVNLCALVPVVKGASVLESLRPTAGGPILGMCRQS
jgi:hypothetical protein